MNKKEQIEMIQEDFKNAQSILTAIGDETRQIILLVLMESDCEIGIRVGEITAKTHLSRPAVSHQLKILKDNGIVEMREEGTKNFYYINVCILRSNCMPIPIATAWHFRQVLHAFPL